ncbi:MAG: hypothetical protein BWZ10_01258 [candidate division BRC1 bacterium ADurb.BinA364]|nr:MAG: hypothetical protein BWZ10_01258 [candidate division BRC1 bacterium ADurb.BinA364]
MFRPLRFPPLHAPLALTFAGMLALASGAPALAREWIVDGGHAAASDEGEGTPGKPLKTILKAAQLARPGDRVLIFPGEYREAVLLPAGGEPGRPITFEASEKGKVVVSGGEPLTDWTRLEGERPIWSAPWPYDFYMNASKGDEGRFHGAKSDPPELRGAELFLWQGAPLRQALSLGALKPGLFFVDWARDRVYVWLPGGGDPREAEMIGAARSILFAPENWVKRRNQTPTTPIGHIVVKGLVFRYAANFPQTGMVTADDGWLLEDCLFEWANGQGLIVRGDGASVVRCEARDNGYMGIGGGGKGHRMKNCVIARNNWKGVNVSWAGGGGKWAHTDGLTIEGLISHDNTGHGLWLDIENKNYTVSGCRIYGNHGLARDSQGAGIFIEISPGPGVIRDNICYSNTGGGIKLAESSDILVENNVLVDNGVGIELRDMVERKNNKDMRDISIRGNTIKDWREAAIQASLGAWDFDSPAVKRIAIDNNIYDPPQGRPFADWGGAMLGSLEEARRALKIEAGGLLQSTAFEYPLVASRTRDLARAESIDERIAQAAAGDIVVLPLYGRSTVKTTNLGRSVTAYDLDSRYVEVLLGDDQIERAVLGAVEAWPMGTPGRIRARVLEIEPALRVQALGVEK